MNKGVQTLKFRISNIFMEYLLNISLQGFTTQPKPTDCIYLKIDLIADQQLNTFNKLFLFSKHSIFAARFTRWSLPYPDFSSIRANYCNFRLSYRQAV